MSCLIYKNHKDIGVYKLLVFNSLLIFVSIFLLFSSVHAAVDDTEAPVLVSVDVAPPSIDVTSADATVTLTARITDDLSGFDYGYFYFTNGGQSKYVYIGQSQRQAGGTELDGIYVATVTFPQFSLAGTWTLTSANFRDNTTNTRTYNASALEGVGGNTAVEVTSLPDETSPVIDNIIFSPASIDASTSDASLTFETSISDDRAGFNYGIFYFYSPSMQQYKGAVVNSTHLLNGDAFNGTYRTTVTFPRYSEQGTWFIRYAYLYDKAGNTWYQTEQALIDQGNAQGFPTTFSVISDPQDVEAPQLAPAGLGFSPIVLNTIDGPDSTTFALRITDNLSGFQNGSIHISSPSGQQHQYASFNNSPAFLKSGDVLDGEYEVIKSFPRYSEFGEWKVNINIVYDRTLNRRQYSIAQLDAMGLPTTLYMEGVISSGSGDYTVGSAGGTIVTDDGGLMMDIPAGAVSEDTDITVTKVGRFDPVNILIGEQPNQGRSIAEYNFDPDGLQFDQPVEVSVSVDVSGLTGRDRNNIDQITVFWYDPDQDAFVDIASLGITLDKTFITDANGDIITVVFTFLLEHFSTYAAILPLEEVDEQAPVVEITVPDANEGIQDYVTFVANVTDESAISSVLFTIREADGNDGIDIGYEEIPATRQGDSDLWELGFDSKLLVDGNYIVYVKAKDEYENEATSSVVPFSIRNWAVVSLLPASETYKAGRTMPVKFALRVDESVDPSMPFVRNENLEIRIFKTSEPANILQASVFGDTATDYRINSLNELYITNFKTDKTSAEYTVEIWRASNNYLIGSFNFETK